MPRIVAVAISLLYFAGVIVSVPRLGPSLSPWFLAIWSVVFVFCHVIIVRGSRMAALSIVLAVTFILPLAALVASGWPHYRSWSGVLGSIYGAFRERGPFAIAELLLPVLFALLAVKIARWFPPRG